MVPYNEKQCSLFLSFIYKQNLMRLYKLALVELLAEFKKKKFKFHMSVTPVLPCPAVPPQELSLNHDPHTL